MYARRVKIHAREVEGFFENLRTAAVIVLLGLYYLVPWIPWDDRQAVLFDLPGRKFHIFALTLWPQDFVFLAWLLIMAALLLFFATAIAGRVWCGYACPQTVWTQTFVWIERLTEGNFNQRIKLDKAPWSTGKWLRRGTKHVLWVLFAAWTGFTFVGYFTPIRELGDGLLGFSLGGWETFWICFYGFATWGNAGMLREQVCIYMCPYARFQGVMFDRDTLIVSYDPARGEPRGGRARGPGPGELGLGDCVDCRMCVQACPTGIDIRKGLQYECITCAACIDACDSVMDRFGYPRGLIRYTTQNAVQGKAQHLVRPRVVVYGTLLLVLAAAFLASLAWRAPVRLDVLRDRNALYRELADGQIENVYPLKILNKDGERRHVRITVDGLPGARVRTAPATIELAPNSLLDVVTRVSVSRDQAPPGRSDVTFRVEAENGHTVHAEREARFMGPLD
ncbi:MAG: cytochrome c oxidase accessory protein CcoG [Gammaproteobacteria bacterium]|nr:cytochrome c oxidase accessory protein CcoG [Gammaproteobacteria bacterium]